MKIFVAHSSSRIEAQVASQIAQNLRRRGHNASAGKPVEAEEDSLLRGFWFRRSFSDPSVKKYIEEADVFIAVCLHDEWVAENVSAEIGFFLARSSRNNLIIVKGESTKIPSYLESPLTAQYSGNIDDITSSLPSMLETISQDSYKKSGQIFLSYSRVDEDVAQDIYSRLCEDGFHVWFDQTNLRAGQDWELEITKAIGRSVAFITLLSSRSVSRRGYFQKELRRSLKVAEEIPEGEIYIIPVKLDDCEIPESLKKYQWGRYEGGSGYDQIRSVLERLLASYSKKDNEV